MQPQYGALPFPDDLLVVRVDEHGDDDPLEADGGLDHVGDVALPVGPDVLELRRRVLRVAGEVEVAAVGDAFQLGPADRIEVLDVARALRVVRPLLRAVLTYAEPAPPQAVAQVPVDPLVNPVAVPTLRLGGRDEVLHLHLLELAHPE